MHKKVFLDAGRHVRKAMPSIAGVVGLVMLSSSHGLAQEIDFAHQVMPILQQHCARCHTGEKKKGGFSMNTRESLLAGGEGGAVLISGQSAQSRLLKLVRETNPDDRMPPGDKPLSAGEIEVLRKWIDAGVPWTPGFAFNKAAYEPPLRPRRPELPPATVDREHPIDRILGAYLDQRKLAHPQTLDDAAFLRRVHLDIIGLLPEPGELEKFLSDKSPGKRTERIRQLLANNIGYAEHWLTFWNDLLRNDYTGTGYIDGGRKQITSWLYASLVENKPYDVMARQLIAPGPESEGFARGIKWRGEVSAGQSVPVQYAQSVGQTFLGINLKCASCHDSFVDRWKLTDAYGLAAVYSDKPLELHRCDKPLGKMAQPAWLFPELGQIDPGKPVTERLRQLAGLMTHPENGRFTRTIVNRLWHRLMGRGIVHPTDAMQTEPWNADLLDYLADDFARNKYDIKKTLELICTSRAYQSHAQVVSAGADDQGYTYAGPRARRMTAEQFVDAVWQLTGTAPARHDAPLKRAPGASNEMVRASLMNSDLLMRALGRPNREQIVSMRPNDLTTLEAMDLNNGQMLAERLAAGSGTLLARDWASPDALVNWVYHYALSRPPTSAEAALARETLGTSLRPEPVQDLLWSICMLPEFQIIR